MRKLSANSIITVNAQMCHHQHLYISGSVQQMIGDLDVSLRSQLTLRTSFQDFQSLKMLMNLNYANRLLNVVAHLSIMLNCRFHFLCICFFKLFIPHPHCYINFFVFLILKLGPWIRKRPVFEVDLRNCFAA